MPRRGKRASPGINVGLNLVEENIPSSPANTGNDGLSEVSHESSMEIVDGENDSESDGDAPRVAQWVDDEELDDLGGSEDSDDDTERPHDTVSELSHLQNDLSGLPLGTLRKALHATQAASDYDDDSASDSETEDALQVNPSKGKEKVTPEWSIKPRPDISKRPNKHAPMEVTSKRPVTRRRTVIEVNTMQPRDPRFLSVAGEFSAPRFQQQYSFLADAHTTELRTLRENLKQARKRLASSPRELLAEREKEVNRLELAIKRAESLVNKDRRDKVEQEALSKLSKEEKDKRKQGKGGWWMKEADKRALLTKARYDALAADGGKRAVKKAIDRKQKKIGQQEKRSRPFSKNTTTGGHDPSRKRAFDSGGGAEGHKRRKVG